MLVISKIETLHSTKVHWTPLIGSGLVEHMIGFGVLDRGFGSIRLGAFRC